MDDLFRFPEASRPHPEVEAYFAASDPMRTLAQIWFERLRALGNDVTELMHDGAPTACATDAAFAYVGAYKAHVSIGFFRGSELPDPTGLLQGSGLRMRHVKLKLGEAIDEAALHALIVAAYRDIKARLAQR